jgi:hypothetical protein
VTTQTHYKFLLEGMHSSSGKLGPWQLGEWRSLGRQHKLELCQAGFHCSDTPLRALGYVKGAVVAEVEGRGDELKDQDGSKSCFRELRVVRAWKWTPVDSILLAAFSAELALPAFEKAYPDDKRPRQAIEVARRAAELLSSGDRSATSAAAAEAAAAEAAAAAAGSAAWSAAEAAAEAAAAAAWSAAEAAAEAAAAAAGSAAWSARSSVTQQINEWILGHLVEMEEILPVAV